MLIGWKPKYNDPKVASVRFRCLTPLEALRKRGFPVEVYTAERDKEYSLVIFSKLYGAADLALARNLASRGIRTALDLSDNHFYNPFDLPEYRKAGDQLREMIAAVDQVICCSAHLARIVEQEVRLPRPALVVGDAVETFDIQSRTPSQEGLFRILWFGSHGSPNAPSGMEDVLRVQRQLEAAARERPTELIIASNNRAKFDTIESKLSVRARYVEWNEQSFPTELARADVVIIPITVNPFTQCKSNNRLATALWYGVPVIADRIPAYDELAPFAYVDDWDDGMRHCLAGDAGMRDRTSAGRRYVRDKFNVEAIATQWQEAMLVAAGS